MLDLCVQNKIKKMKKVLYILALLYMFRLNVYGGNNEPQKFQPCVQSGLSAMYSSVNDTIKGDYLGWPLTCVPLPFTSDFLNIVMSTDTLKYNWESDTICSCNSYEKIGGYSGRLWTSGDRVSIVELYPYYGGRFEIKRDLLIMKNNSLEDLIYTWNIAELKRIYILPDNERIHVHGGNINYYSRAIIKNGKIVDYKTLPNVEIFHRKIDQHIELPIKIPEVLLN